MTGEPGQAPVEPSAGSSSGSIRFVIIFVSWLTQIAKPSRNTTGRKTAVKMMAQLANLRTARGAHSGRPLRETEEVGNDLG